MFVKHDDESARHLREAEHVFLELSDREGRCLEERKRLQAWHLASLANDPERQEEALEECRELLDEDPADHRAIAWAVVRGFDLDLRPSERSLAELVQDGTASLPQTLALASCCLVAGDTAAAMIFKIE